MKENNQQFNLNATFVVKAVSENSLKNFNFKGI